MINDDFIEWLDSPEGQESLQAIDDVQSALKQSKVDADERKIIFPDGERLTIDETSYRIKRNSSVDIEVLRRKVITWLEMDYVPEDFGDKEMEIFERKVDEWIEDEGF